MVVIMFAIGIVIFTAAGCYLAAQICIRRYKAKFRQYIIDIIVRALMEVREHDRTDKKKDRQDRHGHEVYK